MLVLSYYAINKEQTASVKTIQKITLDPDRFAIENLKVNNYTVAIRVLSEIKPCGLRIKNGLTI